MKLARLSPDDTELIRYFLRFSAFGDPSYSSFPAETRELLEFEDLINVALLPDEQHELPPHARIVRFTAEDTVKGEQLEFDVRVSPEEGETLFQVMRLLRGKVNPNKEAFRAYIKSCFDLWYGKGAEQDDGSN
ncbi:MAG: hypothetical protein L0338_16515 [Acidobacteria bacterium]|nr:hypothetical protein [Acidobacteriota bacterium]